MKRLGLIGLLFLVATGAIYGVESSADGTRGQGYIFIHGVLTVLMLAAARTVKNLPQGGWTLVLLLGIAARLLLMGVSPFNTHDVQRYLFDGRMVLEGVDPYRNAPDPKAYEQLYDEGFHVAPEHRKYPTIYPPMALSVFTLCAKAGPVTGLWIWKSLITGASILSLWLIALILRERSKEPWLVWLALSPLAILEVGVGAHVDALAMLGVSGLAWGIHRGQTWASAAGLSFAILSKIIPVWFVLGAWSKPILRKGFAAALLMTLLVYLAAMGFGFSPIGSLLEFAQVWRFGSVLGSFLAIFDMAQHTFFYVFATLFGWMILTHRFKNYAPEKLLGLIFAWGLATSPVLFPWYALSLLPLLALSPSGILIGWTSALPFTYEVIDAFDLSGVWAPSIWPQIILVLSTVLGMVIDGINERAVVLGGHVQSHNSTNTE
jgi:alpha-1,6-mannosyltransferase